MSRVLVTGATGMVGNRLVTALDRVLITTRNPDSARGRFGDQIIAAIGWDPMHESLSLRQHEPIQTVVNLMGESIAEGRWTIAKKKRIRDSRVVGTNRLVDAIANMNIRPEVVISASAVGYYGDRGDEIVNEQTQPADGFLADVCREWEQATLPLVEMGVRLVTIRIAMVLARHGGALKSLLPIFKTGLAGRLGNGKQYFPWIHLDDLVGLILWAIHNESAQGVYNGSAPNPVTNREWTQRLAAALNRPAFIPVPAFAVRWALGEFADSLFDSQRVVPAAAIRDGFEFQFPTLDSCLADLLK